MARYDSPEYLAGLLHELRQLPMETEWVEFKCNNANPEEIGENIAALANSAALHGKANAYLVWGVADGTHEVVGTEFRPGRARKGNEELENWLLRLLSPRINFRFVEFDIGRKHVAMIEIPRATHQPVQFQGIEFIRVGTYRKKLKEFSEKERELWRIFDVTPFEQQVAAERVDASEVLRLLDYPAYFKLLDIPLPESRDGILARLADDGMIEATQDGSWNILNLGAILFAVELSNFRHLARKVVRVIEYEGDGRIKTKREHDGRKGYASGFEGLIGFLKGILPANEVIGAALRKEVPMYPELAIRELVANLIIHQDFTVTGAGPMIEVFDSRLEITNPGEPLMDTQRFLDTPPQSRNESLASFLRRVGICEERGSGVDKVVSQTEYYQLPPPLFEVVGGQTRAVLFAHQTFAQMDKSARVRACYLHACLQYVQRTFMTNSTLRARFGIEDHNRAQASRVIKAAVEAGLVRQNDPDGESRKDTRYVPFWA
ncbi:MAG TPA: ATP-binding protein [Lacipirellulaceae bacterium]|mgnify:CR=1 FL=1|nr:ATP-binding protein [Lacipirellulaceae bacterium]HMP05308.1 ATP-binding protein [Lacipirellulaceae bacterium]